MTMNFECKQLFIDDNPGCWCSIEFRDTIEQEDEDGFVEEVERPPVKYLSIERSYSEGVGEVDWYYIRYSEREIDFSQKDKMYVKLSPNIFDFSSAGETIIIGLNLTEREYARLDRTLRRRFKDMVIMLKD